eukprot:ANDGO_02562.mRNA.1 Putative vacuolar protein sorting-associated protein 13A
MFDNTVAYLLSKSVGKYIQGVDFSSLHMSLIHGDLRLSNIKLKDDLFLQFGLPFQMHPESQIGTMAIKIPWKTLGTESIHIDLRNVIIRISSLNVKDIDPEKLQSLILKIKRSVLDNLVQGDKDLPKPEHVPGLSTQLLELIVQNIHINIDDFVIEWVDANYGESMRIAAREVSVRSVDENGDPVFSRRHVSKEKGVDELLMKRIDLFELSVSSAFWDPKIGFGSGRSPLFLIRPVNISAVSRLNKSQHSFSVSLQETLRIELSDRHWISLLRIAEVFNNFRLTVTYASLRPAVPVHANAGQWWRYAATVVRRELRGTSRMKLQWSDLRQRRQDRQKYISLYKRTNKRKWQLPLSDQEHEELEDFEKELPLDDLRLYRMLAVQELRKEKETFKSRSSLKNSAPSTDSVASAEQKSTWKKLPSILWKWGEKEKLSPEEMASIEISDSDRQELYSSLGWDEKELLEYRDRSIFELDIKIASVNLMLRVLRDGAAGREDRDVCNVLLSDIALFFADGPQKQEIRGHVQHVDAVFFHEQQSYPVLSSQNLLRFIDFRLVLPKSESSADVPSTKVPLEYEIKITRTEAQVDIIILQRLVSFFSPPYHVNVSTVRWSSQLLSTRALDQLYFGSSAGSPNCNIRIDAPRIVFFLTHGQRMRDPSRFLTVDLGSVDVQSTAEYPVQAKLYGVTMSTSQNAHHSMFRPLSLYWFVEPSGDSRLQVERSFRVLLNVTDITFLTAVLDEVAVFTENPFGQFKPFEQQKFQSAVVVSGCVESSAKAPSSSDISQAKTLEGSYAAHLHPNNQILLFTEEDTSLPEYIITVFSVSISSLQHGILIINDSISLTFQRSSEMLQWFEALLWRLDSLRFGIRADQALLQAREAAFIERPKSINARSITVDLNRCEIVVLLTPVSEVLHDQSILSSDGLPHFPQCTLLCAVVSCEMRRTFSGDVDASDISLRDVHVYLRDSVFTESQYSSNGKDSNQIIQTDIIHSFDANVRVNALFAKHSGKITNWEVIANFQRLGARISLQDMVMCVECLAFIDKSIQESRQSLRRPTHFVPAAVADAFEYIDDVTERIGAGIKASFRFSESLEAVIIDDLRGFDVPILKLAANALHMDVIVDSGFLDIGLTSDVCITSYSLVFGSWEPLLDRTPLSANLMIKTWKLFVSEQKESSTRGISLEDYTGGPQTQVQVTFPNSVDLTCTAAAIHSVLWIQQQCRQMEITALPTSLSSADISQQIATRKEYRRSCLALKSAYHPFRVINKLGTPIVMSVYAAASGSAASAQLSVAVPNPSTPTSRDHRKLLEQFIEDQESFGFHFPDSSRYSHFPTADASRRIAISIPEFGLEFQDVSVHCEGHHKFSAFGGIASASSSPSSSNQSHIGITVRVINNTRHIFVHTSVLIRNLSSLDLNIFSHPTRYENRSLIGNLIPYGEHEATPGESGLSAEDDDHSFFVPLPSVVRSFGISFAPSYDVTTDLAGDPIPWSALWKRTVPFRSLRSFEYQQEPGSATKKSFFVLADAEVSSDSSMCILSIVPPVSFENLLPIPATFECFSSSEPFLNEAPLWKHELRSGECCPIEILNPKTDLHVRIIPAGLWKPSDVVKVHFPVTQSTPEVLPEKVALRDIYDRETFLRVNSSLDGLLVRTVSIWVDAWVVNSSGRNFAILTQPSVIKNASQLGRMFSSSSWELSPGIPFSMTENPVAPWDFDGTFVQSSGGHPAFPPVLLSFSDSNKKRHSVRLALGPSVVSESFPIHAGASMSNVSCHSRTECVDFSVTVKPAPGKFFRSSLITVRPHFIAVNGMLAGNHSEKSAGSLDDSQHDHLVVEIVQPTLHGDRRYLSAGQSESSGTFSVVSTIEPKAVSPIFFTNPSSREVQIRIGGQLLDCRLNLAHVCNQEAELVVPGADDVKTSRWVRISNEFSDGQMMLCISPSEGGPPFQLSNFLSESVTFRQLTSEKDTEGGDPVTVDAGGTIPFAWRNPQAAHVVRIEYRGEKKAILLEDVDQRPLLLIDHGAGGTKVFAQVSLEGSRRVLRLYSSEPGLSKPMQTPRNTWLFKLTVAAGSICLVDNVPKEILNAGFKKFGLHLENSGTDMLCDFILGDLQVDNMLADARFPTVLSVDQHREAETKKNVFSFKRKSRQSPKHDAVEAQQESRPLLYVSYSQSLLFPRPTIYINYLSFLMQKLRVSVDESMVRELYRFALASGLYDPSTHEINQQLLEEFGNEAGDFGLQSLAADSHWTKIQTIRHQRDATSVSSFILFIRVLHLNSVSVTFSLHGSDFDRDLIPSSRGHLPSDEPLTPILPPPFPIDRLPFASLLASVGLLFSNISDANISLKSLFLQHVHGSPETIGRLLIDHYKENIMWQMVKVLGHLDFMGNPASLLEDISSGVREFFSDPEESFTLSPDLFARGLARRSQNLISNTIEASFTSATRATSSLGRAAAGASGDDRFISRMDSNEKDEVKHLGEGFIKGSEALAQGIRGGLDDFLSLTDPSAGKLIGIVGKPVAGALAFANRVSQGAQNTATSLRSGSASSKSPRSNVAGSSNKSSASKQREGRMRPPRKLEPGKPIGIRSV